MFSEIKIKNLIETNAYVLLDVFHIFSYLDLIFDFECLEVQYEI